MLRKYKARQLLYSQPSSGHSNCKKGSWRTWDGVEGGSGSCLLGSGGVLGKMLLGVYLAGLLPTLGLFFHLEGSCIEEMVLYWGQSCSSWNIWQCFETVAMTNLDSILKSRDITLLIKVYRVKALISPVVMYRYESRTIRKAERQRIYFFELRHWRRLLRVSWTARLNQSILKEINLEYSVDVLVLKLELQSSNALAT